MTRTARELLDSAIDDLAPRPDANRLVPRIADGTAGRDTLAALALEQRHVIAADRRSFLHLAARCAEAPAAAVFFGTLAEGESLAYDRLGALVAACGADAATAEAYEPAAGCQAYPAYVAWLALGGEPADVVLALTANFAAWGGYCATIAEALRTHYDLDDEACAFFDFFAAPAPDLDRQALDAVGEALVGGRLDERLARRHGRLLQTYEQMFWDTLADME